MKRIFFYSVYLLFAVLVLFELSFRVLLAVQVGPRALAYGTPWYRTEFGDIREQKILDQYDSEAADWEEDERAMNTVYTHENARGGYLKFFPNEAKYHKDVDTGEVFSVGINSRGFRGPEFGTEKPPGTIRVLTLGASSTFGMWNRDHETYPQQLQIELNDRCHDDVRFEVINFAIPHAIADQIRSMFLAEGMELAPDIVTFYEGRNDSFQVHPASFRGGSSIEGEQGQLIGRWLSRTFATFRFLDQVVSQAARVGARETREALETVASKVSTEFTLDLQQIRNLVITSGAEFIVANQQANSKSWFGMPASERLKLKGVTYQGEIDGIISLVDDGQSISGYEFNFLVHGRLMRDLEEWARSEQIPFVDIIGLLDLERHHMVSWVHLDPFANKLVASAFADKILGQTCDQFD